MYVRTYVHPPSFAWFRLALRLVCLALCLALALTHSNERVRALDSVLEQPAAQLVIR